MIFSVFYIVHLQPEHIAAIQCVRFHIFSALDHCDAGLDKLAVDGVECFHGVRFASDRVNDLRRDGVIFRNLRFALRMSSASVTYRRISSSGCHSSIMCPWIISSV